MNQCLTEIYQRFTRICIIINYYDDDPSRKRCAFVRLKYTIQCINSFYIIDI